MANSKNTDWIAIEGEYRAGVISVRAIADKYGITDGAIRKKAKANGWIRDPASTKRQLVRAAMSGGTHEGTHIGLRTIMDAAGEDVADMQCGLRIQRKCLLALENAVDSASEPREIKIIVEATDSAIASIRTIRGLDDTNPNSADNDDDDARAEAIARRLESSNAETET